MLSNHFYPLAVALVSLLVGCGGGGGGGSADTSGGGDGSGSGGAVLVGSLLDAPTAGVSYVCGNQRGKTDSNGRFNYQSGQSCTFSVGNVTIGSMDTVPEDKVVTPYDLVNVSRLSKIDANAIGIAQFLQSVDDGSQSGALTISASTETNLSSVSQQNLATDRSKVKNNALTQLSTTAGSSSFVDRDTASQRMESYLDSINLDRTKRVVSARLPRPSSNSRFQYLYRYGWQTSDQYGLLNWCDMNGNPPNCTPTYYIDGCRSYNGSCTRTNNYEQIADTSSGYVYRAYPIRPTTSFTAKYLGLGVGGGLPDFVKIYDSHSGSWSNSYTPSSGEMPNNLLATSTAFDVFYSGAKQDSNGNSFSRHPGANDKAPGFQAYLGSTGVTIQANNIYWIVVKYSDAGVRNEKCIDHIGPNQFTMPSDFTTDTLLHYGSTTGNGYAFMLMSTDGVSWEPADMISGGICNTFLAD